MLPVPSYTPSSARVVTATTSREGSAHIWVQDRKRQRQPDGYYEVTISRGKGRMPSFPELSDDQVARLIAYIRERQAAG